MEERKTVDQLVDRPLLLRGKRLIRTDESALLKSQQDFRQLPGTRPSQRLLQIGLVHADPFRRQRLDHRDMERRVPEERCIQLMEFIRERRPVGKEHPVEILRQAVALVAKTSRIK